jgi:adenylate cyclase
LTPKPGLTANNGTLKRRLTAIVVADVVGYSQQMAEDEEGTFTRVRALMHDEVPGYVQRHDGAL